MCIRDSDRAGEERAENGMDAGRLGGEGREQHAHDGQRDGCLLYTSDAADERSSVDLGGRRIIKKKQNQ